MDKEIIPQPPTEVEAETVFMPDICDTISFSITPENKPTLEAQLPTIDGEKDES